MPFSRSRVWRVLAPAAALAAAAVTVIAQSGGDRSQGDLWWPGYSGGGDNSRYFASRRIDRSNVGRLEVAWTYPAAVRLPWLGYGSARTA